MLAKRTKKRLFVSYVKKISYDEFNDKKMLEPNERYSCFTVTGSTVLKYYDSFTEWVKCISESDFTIGFGMEVLDERSYALMTLECTEYAVKKSEKSDIELKFSSVVKDYFNDDLDYYYELKTDNVYLMTELTGHIYYRSPYESCDSCGTCNGARCDNCREKYTVTNFASDEVYYSGYNKAEAEEELDSRQEHYSDIIGDIISHYGSRLDMDWFEKEIAGNDMLSDVIKVLNNANVLYTII